MNRETVIQEVKGIYASLCQQETQQHFSQTNSNVNPEKYYEELLQLVLDEIAAGTFDRFQSGSSIVEAVAKDKHKWLSQWDESQKG